MAETNPPAGSTAAATVGLRDVVALASSITSIENGILSYRGINIDELAENASFEEIIHLLWHGKLPNRSELEEIRHAIAVDAVLPQGLVEAMRAFPRRTTPMEGLKTAVAALAMFDAESEDMSAGANARKAVRIQGQMASIVAAYDRIRCPTLLLRGASSDVLSRATAAAMSARGPRARVHEFAGVGHAPTIVAADQVAVVRDFLFGGA